MPRDPITREQIDGVPLEARRAGDDPRERAVDPREIGGGERRARHARSSGLPEDGRVPLQEHAERIGGLRPRAEVPSSLDVADVSASHLHDVRPSRMRPWPRVGIAAHGHSGTTAHRRGFSQSTSSLQTPRVWTIFTRNDGWRTSQRRMTTSDQEKKRLETTMDAAMASGRRVRAARGAAEFEM